VQQVTSDFERAHWCALSKVFRHVGLTQRGFAFHWGQAVYRKLTKLNLATQYRDDRHVRKLCRRLMALPLVPAAEIAGLFERLRRQATSDRLSALFDYVHKTWIADDALWPPACWSVFRRPVRTNNDVEGWHYRLNRRARSGHLPVYVLVRLLHDEAVISQQYVRLVSDGKLTRNQKKIYKSMHKRLDGLWTEFERNETAKQLLYACAYIYGPHGP